MFEKKWKFSTLAGDNRLWVITFDRYHLREKFSLRTVQILGNSHFNTPYQVVKFLCGVYSEHADGRNHASLDNCYTITHMIDLHLVNNFYLFTKSKILFYIFKKVKWSFSEWLELSESGNSKNLVWDDYIFEWNVKNKIQKSTYA